MAHDIAALYAIRKRRRAGFTLLELSIVVLIIGIITSISLYFGVAAIANARVSQTKGKLDRIEHALEIYREQTGLFPCPENLATQTGNADPNPGTCSGIPAAYNDSNGAAPWHKVAEGGVPYQTLSLPEDYMYDAWGHRILYAVDTKMTQYDAFKNASIYDQCAAIRVLDQPLPGGNDRTAIPGGAVYVLASMGPNGHGGMAKSGVRYNAGSTDPGELANCNCDNTATLLSPFVPLFVQKDITGTFDDLVRDKERWQMQTLEESNLPVYAGPEFAIGNGSGVSFYGKNCDTYTSLSTFSFTGTTNGIAVSPDDVFWAVAHGGSPYLTIYQRDVTSGQLLDMNLPAISGDANAVAFSPTGTYVVAGNNAAPYLYVFKNTASIFSPLSGAAGFQTLPAAAVSNVAFSYADQYVAAISGGSVLVYIRSGDAFLPMPGTPVLPGATSVAFSPSGQVLAIASPTGISLYKTSDLANLTPAMAFANTPDPQVVGASSLSYSAGGIYLSAAKPLGGVTVYRVNTDTGTLGAMVANALNSPGTYAVNFSPRQDTLGMAASLGANSYMYSYVPNTDAFSNNATIAVQGNAIAMRY